MATLPSTQFTAQLDEFVHHVYSLLTVLTQGEDAAALQAATDTLLATDTRMRASARDVTRQLALHAAICAAHQELTAVNAQLVGFATQLGSLEQELETGCVLAGRLLPLAPADDAAAEDTKHINRGTLKSV